MLARPVVISILNTFLWSGDFAFDRAIRRWSKLKLAALAARHNLDYESSRDDIFLVSYPKSGTTWMQMIVHEIISGNEDFDHIDEVFPFFERACLLAGHSVQEIGKPLKSHVPYQHIPKGQGKYIYVFRDGRDVAVSYYHHYIKYFNFGGTFDDFFQLFMSSNVGYGSWFDHVAKWTKNRRGLDVLIVSYEDLLKDLPRQVKIIAEFLSAPVNNEKISQVVSRSSFEFMKTNEGKFELPTGDSKRRAIPFFRNGKSGEGRAAVIGEALESYVCECRRAFPSELAAQFLL